MPPRPRAEPSSLRDGLRPTLHGVHVTLRPVRLADAHATAAATRVPENSRFTGSPAEFTIHQVRAHLRRVIDNPDRVDLAICRRGEDDWLGEAVLNQIDWTQRCANFRILLAGPQVYGQGLGSEATRLLVDHGFAALGLHRIELEVFDFNARARHVYAKAGFEMEGVRRDALWWDGAWHASVLMSQLEDDWRRRRRGDS